MMNKRDRSLTSKVRRYVILAIVVWTALVAGLLVKDVVEIKRSIRSMVLQDAANHFNKDYATRLWAASHGGVYVPATEKTPPNPYLANLPERDIRTPSGKVLTLMNPAYMLREMMEQYGELFGIWCHITSLKYFRDETAPDEWEKAALIRFERGTKEVADFASVHGNMCLRLMKPLKVEQACLKCHAAQGYRLGDIRGGVSVSVPMKRYLAVERKEILFSVASFSLLWVVGMGGILFAGKRLATHAKEREAMEWALHASEKNYSAVFENSLTGIYILQDGKIKLANQLMAEMHGFTKEELIGMDALELVHPEDRPVVKDFRERRLKGEPVPSVYEIRTLRKDGKVIWVQRRNTLVSFNGKPAVLGNVLDISPLKESEEKMRRQTEELLRSNKELEAFAAVASHDLQEPLRKIRNFGGLLERKFADKIGEEGADYLSRIRNAVGRMQSLIDALLSYSHVTRSRLPFETVSLGGIVHEVVSDLDVLIESKGARLHVEELPTIEADPIQMRQLFQNLISNSLKFAPDHEPSRVRIHSEVLKQPKAGCVRIFVEDNGIGFDEKYAERIFYPFERLHSRAAYEGAGMGLAICRKIVERHGGVIEAKGLPGKGATLLITLPITQEGRCRNGDDQ